MLSYHGFIIFTLKEEDQNLNFEMHYSISKNVYTLRFLNPNLSYREIKNSFDQCSNMNNRTVWIIITFYKVFEKTTILH